jgi:hypothetical protein
MDKPSNIDLDGLSRFLESIGSSTFAEDLIFGPGPGESLFHYTDLIGLQGIVQKHDLWLTHSKYSNDDEEMTHGYRVVKEVIDAERSIATSPERVEYLDYISSRIETPAPEGVYICCFCLEDNLLSQWRAYGANGTGVSIKFNHRNFAYITGPDSPHGGLMRLWKVIYEVKEKKSIIKRAIDFAFADSKSVEDRARQAMDAIQFFIPTLKNEDFREERECRLIFTPSAGCRVKPDFRVGRGMLIPYYSLRKLSSGDSPSPHYLPIEGVRVGPSANKRLNAESAELLLLQAGYSGVVVESSDTPFRG